MEQTYARARELCQQLGPLPQLFPTLYGLTAFSVVRGDLQTAYELSEQLLGLAHNATDSALLVIAHRAMGTTLFFRGQFAAACEHLEHGIALYDPLQQGSLKFLYGVDAKVVCLCYLAQTLWYLGYPAQARQRIRELLSLVQELPHPYSRVGALCNTAWVYQHCRDAPATQMQAEVAIALAAKQGFAPLLAIGHICRGWALVEQSQLEDGLAEMTEGLAALRATETNNILPHHLGLLGEVYGKAGQIESGLAVLAEAVEIVNRTEERQREAELYRLKGELTLAQSSVQGLAPSVRTNRKAKSKGQKSKIANPHSLTPNPQAEAEAEACFLKAIEIARHQQAKSWELRAAMSLSRLWQHQGKPVAARQLLAEVYNWFTEGFDTKDLQEAKALLDELAH